MTVIKDLFLLDPEVIFLNHGSFGAVPRVVFDTYQRWQQELERQPVKFLGREIFDHYRAVRESLAGYLGADPKDLVYVPNATFAVNLVARSLDLKEGDEILISNHEYGACENAWRFIAGRRGAIVRIVDIPLPLPPPERIVDLVWEGVSERTKVIFLSQITSPTAVRLPAEAICHKANQAGILTFIDGAHAPGQLDLDLKGSGADLYTGNCHKWMMAPKGSAFLYARPEHQDLLDPLVISWGWGENSPFQGDTKFLQNLEWWGTMDPAAFLSVPAAIQFQHDNQWSTVRERCSRMLTDTLAQIEALTGMPSIYSAEGPNAGQLGTAELPGACQPGELQRWLYETYRIEIPVIEWEGRWFIRPSIQGYNNQEDIKLLLRAIQDYLGKLE